MNEITIDHIREQVWAHVGNYLSEWGWRCEEQFFISYTYDGFDPNRNENDIIADDQGLRDYILYDKNLEMVLVDLDRYGSEEEDEEEEEEDSEEDEPPCFNVFVRMVNDTHAERFEVHDFMSIGSFREEVANRYNISVCDLRLLFQGMDLDDSHDLYDISNSMATIQAMARSRGGGVKRTLEDREKDVSNSARSAMDAVNPSNRFLGTLQQLHNAVMVQNDNNIFEKLINEMNREQLDAVEKIWNECSFTNSNRVINDIWKVMCPEFHDVFQAEEDVRTAKKMITTLLEMAYLREFPNGNGTTCDHSLFENLIAERRNAIYTEEEITRRVNEIRSKRSDDEDL